MKNHGVFTIGPSPESALKSAIVAEDVAKTYWLALAVGEPTILGAEEVAEHHRWYKSSYGQM
jgi:L-ribulose-5-phosphate 4-epimerase